MGVTLVTTATYWLAVASKAAIPGIYPLLGANVVAALLVLAASWFLLGGSRPVLAGLRSIPQRIKDGLRRAGAMPTSLLGYRVVVAVLLLSLAWLLFFWVFRMEGAKLLAGITVFGDYGPNMALSRSFAVGNNFPAEYPHFPGDGIRYHFFFYFLIGNLDYLGLPVDLAYNVPSALAMFAVFALLGELARTINRHRWVPLIAFLLVIFRSTFSWLEGVLTTMGTSGVGFFTALGQVWRGNEFPGNQPNEAWGLFNLNVFANQRHFMWGFAMLLLVMLLFLPAMRRGLEVAASIRQQRNLNPVGLFFQPELWTVRRMEVLLAALIVVLPMPYWHGAAFLALMLVLMAFGLVSEEKPALLALGILGGLAAWISTKLFWGVTDTAISPSIYLGYIAPKPLTLATLVTYIVVVFGPGLLLMLVVPLLQPAGWRRYLAVVSWLPFLFAFTISLTPDPTVNEKYIMVGQLLWSVFLADLLVRLGAGVRRLLAGEEPRRDALAKVAAAVVAGAMGCLLVLGGVIDANVYVTKNGASVEIDTSAELTTWAMTHTSGDEIFITPTWSYHSFFYSGRRVWYGHPYYAWSAGYPTLEREEQLARLVQGQVPVDEMVQFCRQHNIRYFVASEDWSSFPVPVDINKAWWDANFESV
ncbi:MAG: hypothetical protein CSA63_01500, partial [Propionibacterium sp.]